MISLTRWVRHSTIWEQQQKICLWKMSTSSHEGNLVVIHYLTVPDYRYWPGGLKSSILVSKISLSRYNIFSLACVQTSHFFLTLAFIVCCLRNLNVCSRLHPTCVIRKTGLCRLWNANFRLEISFFKLADERSIVCEISRLALLTPRRLDRCVWPGGASAPQRQKFRTDDFNVYIMKSLGLNLNLVDFMFLLVDYGKGLCS